MSLSLPVLDHQSLSFVILTWFGSQDFDDLWGDSYGQCAFGVSAESGGKMHAPYIAFPSGRAADSSLGLFYSIVGLCANVGHDSLDSILDGTDDGVFPAGDAIGAEGSDSQEAEGKIQSRQSKRWKKESCGVGLPRFGPVELSSRLWSPNLTGKVVRMGGEAACRGAGDLAFHESSDSPACAIVAALYSFKTYVPVDHGRPAVELYTNTCMYNKSETESSEHLSKIGGKAQIKVFAIRFSTNQGAHSGTSLTPSLREVTWYFGTCKKQNDARFALIFLHTTSSYIRVVGDNLRVHAAWGYFEAPKVVACSARQGLKEEWPDCSSVDFTHMPGLLLLSSPQIKAGDILLDNAKH
ncbi:hypothetical protein KCU83_g51, partial [Aureobasidium melanogenum]